MFVPSTQRTRILYSRLSDFCSLYGLKLYKRSILLLGRRPRTFALLVWTKTEVIQPTKVATITRGEWTERRQNGIKLFIKVHSYKVLQCVVGTFLKHNLTLWLVWASLAVYMQFRNFLNALCRRWHFPTLFVFDIHN